MKVMLILENRPAFCRDCPCWDNIGYCNAADEPAGMYQQPEFCPLKPMPIKQDTKSAIGIDLVDGFKDGWNYGWNACLEELEK